jgi:hypothetical protein
VADSGNMMDGVADELLGWLQTESSWYANALKGRSQKSPFAADASEPEKLDYYRRQMYMTKPDGTVQYDQPNTQGRQNLINRLGVQGYAQVYEAVRPKQQQGKRSLEEPAQVQDAGQTVEPPSFQELLGPGVQDAGSMSPAPPMPQAPAPAPAPAPMPAQGPVR